MRKPNFIDYKYNNLSLEEHTREYERDLMLWEQTEALKEANETQKQQYEYLSNDEYGADYDYNYDSDHYNVESIEDINETPNESNTPSTTSNTDLAQIQLAQQLNINYLLIKKLYKVIESYKDYSTTFKQILTTWIEFRQNHYEYDYEAFLEEFDYDKVITNKYSTIDITIKPKVTGTKEDYERMIKKLIKTIMNDEGYDHVSQLQIVGL